MSDNSENPVSSLFKTLKDRLESPITGTLTLSWLLTNWRVPLLLIYERTPKTDRIDEIRDYLNHTSIYRLIVIPILITAVYLIVLPLIREFYSKWITQLEFRVAWHSLSAKSDLQEVEHYRNTISAISSYLKKELLESRKNDEIISLMCSDVITSLHNFPQTSTAHQNLQEMKSRLQLRMNQLDNTNKDVENFFNQYSGSLPDMYKGYVKIWAKNKKN